MSNRKQLGNEFRTRQHRRDEDKSLDDHNKEEYASEVAPGAWVQKSDIDARPDVDDDAGVGAGVQLGWVALVFAIASLFFWPIIMGPTAAVLGFYAYRQGQRSMGTWSMVIGAIAFFVFAFIIR
ncbi:MFS transporter [Paenibacillus selenitireducens]|uniref:hypothetical protein n=1 Tax=Paenibacillus selenitireducens TaxID=1324314 RepID=UPI0009989D26|nr:hypothetical protein [Paenibacillus selenitireducens]